MGAPLMVSNVAFENIYTNGTDISGGCKDHPMPKALQIHVLCMAPAGQDAPCFKDTDGKPYPHAKPSDPQAGHNLVHSLVGTAGKAGKTGASYGSVVLPSETSLLN
jgi:hypothetical protein